MCLKKVSLVVSFCVPMLMASVASASLMLTVNRFTTDELSVSISGTFDTDVSGEGRYWLALKSNYTNNDGINVDWIADSIGFTLIDNAPNLTVIENSVEFDGSTPFSSTVAATGENWGDSFYWRAGFDILAGTSVSGTLHVSGANIFNPTGASLQLASGFDFNGADLSWNRLEAVGDVGAAVPEPATLALVGAGLAGLGVAARRRRKS